MDGGYKVKRYRVNKKGKAYILRILKRNIPGFEAWDQVKQQTEVQLRVLECERANAVFWHRPCFWVANATTSNGLLAGCFLLRPEHYRTINEE